MLNFIQDNDSEELRELGRSVRKFADTQFTVDSEESLQFRRADFSAMGGLGLGGIVLSEEVGGSAMNSLAMASCIFEISRRQLGPAIYLSVHLMVARLIEKWSTTGAHTSLMKQLSTGEKLAAFCLTEAQAGSDAAALQTKAVANAGGYLLSGEKIYITSAGEADVYLVFARTDSDPRKGISAFIVEKDNPGISFGPAEKKMGCEGSPIASVLFENCQVDKDALLADEGLGYKIALSGLNGGRISIAAASCGLASRAIELARSHVTQRKQFGKELSSFQGLQFMLADMYTLFQASVLLTRDAAQANDRGENSGTAASAAKCFATDAAMKICTDAVQLLGGAGYLWDYEVERLMRGAKMLQIVEGTNQIQRVLIARGLLQ